MKIDIIGHRGAAGLALENSSNAIKQALAVKTPMLEIDCRLTSDKKLVVNHDADLLRTAGDNRKISNHTYAELKDVKLNDGSSLLTLAQALKLIGTTPVMIELKNSGSEYELLNILEQFPSAQVSVASYKVNQLAVLRELSPTLSLYVLEHTKGVEITQLAKRLNLTGIALNFWVLNPHIYWLARRAGLEIYVYTINNHLLVWLFKALYPSVMICTDRPDKFIAKR